jgi:integrase
MEPISWQSAIFSYLTTLTAVGRAAGTVRLKRYYLRRLQDLAPRPDLLTGEHLAVYIAAQVWEPETRRSFTSTVRAFYRWAVRSGHAASNPVDELPPVSIPPAVPRPASDRDIALGREHAEYRVKLMILLGSTIGLRCCEISRIHSRDWDGRELIVHGKGSKDRALPVTNLMLVHVLNHLDGYLFPGRIDGHLSAGYVSKLIGQALPGETTAHQLRHRCATVAYAETHDLMAVSTLLGHSKPETTKRYVRVASSALLAAVRAADVA